MAKKSIKKAPVKAKSAPAVKTKAAPAKKAKSAATKSAPKSVKSPQPQKKPAVSAKDKSVPPVQKASPSSVKKTPSKKAAPASKTKTPAPTSKSPAKTSTAPAAPAKSKGNGAAASQPEAPAKKGKGTASAVPTPPPVLIPKVKGPIIENAPEITIKPSYNPKKMPPFYKKQQTRLIELRSALYDTMDGMAKETLRSRPEGSDASVGGMHMGDAGSDAYDRDFALSMLSKEQDALYEITEALGRLDRGVYGICELSGKKIPDERLEALPYTRYTREMQEQIERDNMGGKFRRPVVRSVFGLDDASEEDEDEEGESTKESSPQESSLDFMKE